MDLSGSELEAAARERVDAREGLLDPFHEQERFTHVRLRERALRGLKLQPALDLVRCAVVVALEWNPELAGEGLERRQVVPANRHGVVGVELLLDPAAEFQVPLGPVGAAVRGPLPHCCSVGISVTPRPAHRYIWLFR